MADVADLTLPTYADWSETVTWTNSAGAAINLTGYTISMKIRSTPTATASVSLSIGSGITVATPSSGVYVFRVTAAQLGALTPGVYYYDAIATSSGGVATQLYKGKIYLKASMSHD